MNPDRRESAALPEKDWNGGHPERVDDYRVIACLEAYAAALGAGDKPKRTAVLTVFPEIAEEVAACLESLELLSQFETAIGRRTETTSEN